MCARTVFVNGTTVSPDFLNAINNPVFDNQNFDGHYPRITNNDLSDTPGEIKPEWVNFRDALKVSAGNGLSLTYSGGVVTLANGAIFSISPGALALPDNATSFIFVNSAGAVVSSTIQPVAALMLARVVTVSGGISGAVVDFRPRFSVLPRAAAIKIFGGNGDQGVYNLTGTDLFSQGEYYFSSFTIASTATLTIDKGAKIFVSGSVRIAGTINVAQASNGGFSFSSSVVGTVGGLSGTGPGGGSGSGVGVTYNYTLAFYGSGGGAGFIANANGSASSSGKGGKGGGGMIIEAAGDISITGTINATGENGTTGSTTGTPIGVSGGGGGSGGLVLLKSLASITIANTATIDIRGGSGGNGLNDGSPGGGGGGGQVVLISPANNATGATILLSGGAKGTSTGTNSLGGGVGGGFGGSGGTSNANGSIGQLIIQNFIPVG